MRVDLSFIDRRRRVLEKMRSNGLWDYKNLAIGFFSSLPESPPFGHLAEFLIWFLKCQRVFKQALNVCRYSIHII
jgi:hypothetical protein